MMEGLKVLDKWAPISGSPIVNVSRVHYLSFFRKKILKNRMIGKEPNSFSPENYTVFHQKQKEF